ncbi:hypothetical protein K3495_g14613, partial [Podosphaera aphanis]
MKTFHGNTAPMIKPAIPKTDIGTATIASIECLEHFMGVKMDNLKDTGLYLTKARDSMLMKEAKTSEMAGVENAIESLTAHTTVLQAKMKVTRIVERVAALEKAIRKSLKEPARKAAPQTVLGSCSRSTYASIVAPPTTKA